MGRTEKVLKFFVSDPGFAPTGCVIYVRSQDKRLKKS